MRLKSFRVTEFKSIRDSQSIEIGDVTCLVGKNESGKTALLQALYRLNPIIPQDATFNVTEDYPRAYVKRYERGVKQGQDPQIVVEAAFEIAPEAIDKLEAMFCKGVFRARELVLSRGYSNELLLKLDLDEGLAISAVATSLPIGSEMKDAILHEPTVSQLYEVLNTNLNQINEERNRAVAEANAMDNSKAQAKQEAIATANGIAESEKVQEWRKWAAAWRERGFEEFVYQDFLEPHVPRFLYFDEFYQMEGHVNIPALKARQQNKALQQSDHPMLGLIDLAGLDVDSLVRPPNTQDLINHLEGASNDLTRQIMPYWSQNKHLAMRFDIRQAAPGDPVGMREGMNLWAQVYDSAHLVTIRVGTRSRGFIWFFSFLAWFSQHKKSERRLILLLDEPGLFLHASAQADLLRYIDAELMDNHQVVYSTHSPFMIDSRRFDRVRLVRDRTVDSTERLPEDEEGTKVYSDPLEVDGGTLFPLQGSLGYDIAQSLFVGPNTLIVEGVSDLLYLQALTEVLISAGREGLAPAWTITPVGGSDKVPTFVALLGGQKKMKIATLIDYQKKDRQSIENMYKKGLLLKKNIMTYADFTETNEADIEDMFEEELYLHLVNEAYKASLVRPIDATDLPCTKQRILVRIEKHLETSPMGNSSFNHYRPARYFLDHINVLSSKLSPSTLDRFEKAFKALNALL